jgi:carboxyl-terminal processing protease
MKKIKHLLILSIISLFLVAFFTYCSDDDNEIVAPQTIDKQTLMVNNFINENMELYYFWNNEMPDIDQEKETNSSDYFYKLLKEPDDKWSFITDDYERLLNYFAGIEKSTGYSIMPMYFSSESNQVVVFIEYVYPGTPAEEAGLKRGDMIYKIDGQQLDDENYSSLLDRTTFEITLGKIESDGSISEIDPPVQLEALELNLYPIVKTSIIDTLGHKIGYLAYSSFIHEYNQDLENVIEEFNQAGVTEMVLDLRYNGGGAVSTAQLLGNMLVPEGNAGNTFIESVYNNTVTNEIKRDPDYTPDFFLRKFEEHENNLGINTLYIFTTQGTASASEMMIYGLDPYMDVVQIGTRTHGKYYASITLSDEENHNWAIQPIILRSINALDNINYSQGLAPDYELTDDFYNYEINELGHHREPFMSKAISLITGQSSFYENNTNQVKSGGSFLRKDNELRKTIYPNRSRMWINPDELPTIR